MADKRNKQASRVQRRLALSVALGEVVIWGRSLFEDEPAAKEGGASSVHEAERDTSRPPASAQISGSEGKLLTDEMTREKGQALVASILESSARGEARNALVGRLREGFPGEGFPFWKRQYAVPDKPFLERRALLDALRALVEGQLRRFQHSHSLIRDPVRHFSRLYRRELLAAVSEDAVLSPWRLLAHADAISADRDNHPDEENGAWFDADSLEAADRQVDARLTRELRFFFLGLFVRAIPPGYKDDLFAPMCVADLNEPVLVRAKAALAKICRYYEFETYWEQLKEALCPKDSRLTGVTEGECRAVGAAVGAILRGASPFAHSRRGDALRHSLTQTQMRQLRSACAKDGAVRPFLLQLSCWLTDRREKYLSVSGVQLERPKRARGRIGLLAKDAREVERSGCPGSVRIARGVRAVMKGESGAILTDEEIGLAREAALWWQQTVLRPSQRAGPSWVPVSVEDFEGPAGVQRLGDTLIQALYYWPEGARALGAQLPPSNTNCAKPLPLHIVTVPRRS
jgi:hypothetical protein